MIQYSCHDVSSPKREKDDIFDKLVNKSEERKKIFIGISFEVT